MKKSNKGFTLIELLAAIVILGILFLFAAPNVVSLVTGNRDKMYVTDAKKLMAQAEYKIKSSSSTMEKPTEGNCIAISLVYLDDKDFDVAPNRGKYIKEASFVIVKNTGSGLEYSVAIVEQLKDGSYKGIPLTKGSLIEGSNAIKYVRGISASEIIKIEDNLDTNYINDRIKITNGGDYVTDIEHFYNEPELIDDSTIGGYDPPKITKANLVSTSGKDYNSLDATLTITVDDNDTPRSQLKVYLSTKSYEDAIAHGEHPYGENNSFTKKYDFSTERDASGKLFSYDINPIVNLYIVVKDPTNEEDKKVMVYELHQNEPPSIGDTSGFHKLPDDKVNRVDAKLKLDVSDDIDSIGDLKVCFSENLEDGNCTNYRKYSDLFDLNTKEADYSFSSDKCNLNGQTKKVQVFVKDSKEQVTTKTYQYVIHKDEIPKFDTDANAISVVSESEPFTSTNSLKVQVKVRGSDDVSHNNDMKVLIYEPGVSPKSYDYSPTNQMSYTLSGVYDGEPRDLTIQLEDECHHKSAPVVYTPKYTVYKNKGPTISQLAVTSQGTACREEYPCTGTGGSKYADVNFVVTDDIDYNDISDSVKICVTENANGCTNDSDFQNYSVFESGYTFEFGKGLTNPYDGSKKNFYVFAKDSYGTVSKTSLTGGYQIYSNHAPDIDSFTIESSDSKFTSDGSLDIAMFIRANDDLTEFSQMTYSIKSGNQNLTAVGGGNCAGDLSDYDPDIGIKCKLPGSYDGGIRQVQLTLTDSNGVSSTATQPYQVYKNKPPIIYKITKDDQIEEGGEGTPAGDGNSETEVEEGMDIVPHNAECSINYKCPYLGDQGGSADVDLVFNVLDDMDETPVQEEGTDIYEETNLKICVAERDSDCCTAKNSEGECTSPKTANFISYANFLNDNSHFRFNKGLADPYDGQEHTVYVYAMDSLNAVSKGVVERYTLYKNEKPRFIYDKTEEDIEGNVTTTENYYPTIHTAETTRFSTEQDNQTNPGEGEQTVDPYKDLFNIKHAKFSVEVDDDFDQPNNIRIQMCYKILPNGSQKCNNDLQQYNDEYDVYIDVNKYSGQEVSVYAYAYDSLGNKSDASNAVTYKLYKDDKPKLKTLLASYTEGSAIGDESSEPETNICVETDDGYYDANGNSVSLEEYAASCLSEDGEHFYCVTFGDKYYDSHGDEVEPEVYANDCLADENGKFICKEVLGKYYDSKGREVTKETMLADPDCGFQDQGEYTCEFVNNKYYGSGGTVVTESEYNTQCVGKTICQECTSAQQKVKFSFIVQDPYDKYKVCINKTGKACKDSEYVGINRQGTGFDGSTLDTYFAYYIEPRGVHYDSSEEGNPTENTYYVFIKDQDGNIAKRITELPEESELANCAENNNCPKECETSTQNPEGTCSTVSGVKYVQCSELAFNYYRAEFELDTEKTNLNDAISATKCGGRCYFATADEISSGEGQGSSDEEEDTSEELVVTNFKAFYKKKLFYKDAFDPNIACDDRAAYEKYDGNAISQEHDCSFIECFKKSNKTGDERYQTMAIGMRKRILPYNDVVTYTDGDNIVHVSQEYYTVYVSSYDGKSDVITLNPTGDKVTPYMYMMENSEYPFNPNAEGGNYYVRVRD